MKAEKLREPDVERDEADRLINDFFGRLARGDSPETTGLDVEYLEQVLTEAGADLVPIDLEAARESLAHVKYSEKHPDRRYGLQLIWGVENIAAYEVWALGKSVNTCPRATFKKKGDGKLIPIDGSQDRGLKLMLADLTEMAIREDVTNGKGMSVIDFVRRTDVRVRFGVAYAEMKEAEVFGKDDERYLAAKKKYKEMDKANDTKGLYMIPPGSLLEFWTCIKYGGLPR